MTLTGHIIGGQIVLDNPAPFPDGASVRVEVVALPVENALDSDSPVTLKERLKRYLSNPPLDLPPDAAENHDYYLYGGGEL